MKKSLLLILLTLFFSVSFAQNTEKQSINELKKHCESIVHYLEETLNFLGDPESTVQEKEIIINQSYNKIFLNDEVQVEDDLDESRETPINKDIQAYLKDVDFFFERAKFTFDIDKVEQFSNEQGGSYFKVSLTRTLDAVAVGGDTVNNTRQRFIEINYDEASNDLKIVSFYTTKLNEREELRFWWNQMDDTWRNFFATGIKVFDTLPLVQIKTLLHDGFTVERWYPLIRQDSFLIVGADTLPLSFRKEMYGRPADAVIFLSDTVKTLKIEELKADISPVYTYLRNFKQRKEINISYRTEFDNLEPISELSELELIDFSNTRIHDISPLRNLNKLKAIYFSGTGVSDLNSLKYSVGIEEIYCFNTNVSDINVMENFCNLKTLYCFNTPLNSIHALRNSETLAALRISNTSITDIYPLSEIKSLNLLDVSETGVFDINALQNLHELQTLNLDKTKIKSLKAIENLEKLSIIQFSYTNINTLENLQTLKNLKSVYCDNSKVSTEEAKNFMQQHPNVLVVFETSSLKDWWNELPIYWKSLFAKQVNISSEPNAEELHLVVKMKKLDISNNVYLQSLDPVSRLEQLESLNVSKTEITDLRPLSGLTQLKVLNVANTRIFNLVPLSSLKNLEELNIENTRVQSLTPLHESPRIKLVEADGSRLTTQEAVLLKHAQQQVLVVYQTEELNTWWGNLSQEWRDIFAKHIDFDVNPDKYDLQELIDLETVEIGSDIMIQTIEPLSKFLFIKQLSIKSNGVRDLTPLKNKVFLQKLEIPSNPITDLKPLQQLKALEALNIESTPIADLSPIQDLTELRVLNVAGTTIRSLKPLSNLKKLEDVSVYNTTIRQLSPLDELPNLKHLKCYNTRLKAKDIEKLQKERIGLNILFY
ncbi:MAG: hypothetical protein LBM67_05835 [Lentimicrobiaceae bacterium]|nr:hypothetical protein [Lentimicrobiaceae bacterium]